jgi:cytochrome c
LNNLANRRVRAAAYGIAALGCLLPQAHGQTPAPAARPPEVLFRTCKACHSIDKDGEDQLGPNLWGIAGRKAASRADFPYSAALRNSGIVWTDANLDQWLTSPSKFVPGSKMAYPGNPNAADRAALISYLKSHAD